MQNYQLSLVANERPETLERILRVIRHRGFRIIKMKMQLDNEKLWLDLTVSSQKDICLLVNQLTKLYDVIDVVGEDCDC